jgi:hypothetical protein
VDDGPRRSPAAARHGACSRLTPARNKSRRTVSCPNRYAPRPRTPGPRPTHTRGWRRRAPHEIDETAHGMRVLTSRAGKKSPRCRRRPADGRKITSYCAQITARPAVYFICPERQRHMAFFSGSLYFRHFCITSICVLNFFHFPRAISCLLPQHRHRQYCSSSLTAESLCSILRLKKPSRF